MYSHSEATIFYCFVCKIKVLYLTETIVGLGDNRSCFGNVNPICQPSQRNALFCNFFFTLYICYCFCFRNNNYIKEMHMLSIHLEIRFYANRLNNMSVQGWRFNRPIGIVKIVSVFVVVFFQKYTFIYAYFKSNCN